jgi:NADH:ubiquinone oxidoreductase subunit 4 (subunit M)
MTVAVVSLFGPDVKTLGATLSTIHMNVGLACSVLATGLSVVGSLMVGLSHALTSTSFFITVGFVFEYVGSRIVCYTKGLAMVIVNSYL